MACRSSSTETPGFETQCHLRARLGVEHIPALGLAEGRSHTARAFVIRVHLYGKLVGSEEKLHQQGKAIVVRGSLSHHCATVLLRDLPQGFPAERTVGNAVVTPCEPAFANGLLHDLGIHGTQIAHAPGPFVEAGNQE